MLSFTLAQSQSTGRIVINEYMPWTSNGCGITTEFVELLNYGPGPVDIGCYILTDGDFSVTIPPNTILQPGQFYVLSGEDVVPGPCANTDSTITVNLNWTTCGCTSAPIPTTGDGFFTDGGSANEQIVLFDPALNVIDAVVRSLPLEPSSPITSASFSGNCISHTFNIDTMSINYEELGMSAGRANSFARTMDADCMWVKDPQQSADATNNRSGRTSDITYAFTVTNTQVCDSTEGSVSIFVKHNNYATVFPMNYTLALDTNNNGIFELNDKYITGYDSTPPEIQITNLPVGHFRVTVGSVKGCYLKTFEFTILPCYPLLPVQLIYFRHSGENNKNHRLEWMLSEVENVKSVTLEKAMKNRAFITHQFFEPSLFWSGSRYFTTEVAASVYTHFRLKIILKDGSYFYSPVINTSGSISFNKNKIWPNPVSDQLNMELPAIIDKSMPYFIYNINGVQVTKGWLQLKAGTDFTTLSVNELPRGHYQLQIGSASGDSPTFSFPFVKH